MSRKLGDHIRSNVVGYVALFWLMTGTAMAVDGSLAGQNTVGSADIIDGEVTPADIKADSIGSAKIAPQSVKNSDLGLGASSSNTIEDGGVQSIDIKDETLTGADVKFGSLTGDDLAPGAVDRLQIQFDAVSGEEIESGTILASDLATDVIPADGGLGTSEGSSKLATGSVGRLELKGQSVDGGSVIDNTLNGLDILDASITTVDVDNKSLTSDDIKDGAIGSDSIADGSVGQAELNPGVVAPRAFAIFPGSCNPANNCPLEYNHGITSFRQIPEPGLGEGQFCIKAGDLSGPMISGLYEEPAQLKQAMTVENEGRGRFCNADEYWVLTSRLVVTQPGGPGIPFVTTDASDGIGFWVAVY